MEHLLYWNVQGKVFSVKEVHDRAHSLMCEIYENKNDPDKALEFLSTLVGKIQAITPRFPFAPIGWVVNLPPFSFLIKSFIPAKTS